MPWKELSVMDQRKEFILKAFDRNVNFSRLCSEYGISTKTGYKWKDRFKTDGLRGLFDESKRPHSSPQKISEDYLCEIIYIKTRKPDWGSRKIHRIFLTNHPDDATLVSRSTVDRILKKAGLVVKSRRRKKISPQRLQNRITAKEPNDLWTVDFKGWWYTPNKEKCEPLTVRDEFSKYILSIKILEKADISSVKQEFEELFKKYGLPKVIRSDNGPPFAHHAAVMGLTKLSAWWLALGILLDRIEPGHPYQNGSHERMHRDIKKELQGKIDGNLKLHQHIFDEWKHEYNYVRPHDALDLKCPADVYVKSKRKYLGTIYDVEYPYGFNPRRVNDKGMLIYRGHRVFISNAFCGYHLGIKKEDADNANVWLNSFPIGKIDLKTFIFLSTMPKLRSMKIKTLPIS
jgi:transposase InsO family protein